MSLKCGIVGLPNVGKSTLFNALTKAGIAAENYPFCTIEPNVGVVELPDPRLAELAAIVKPERVLPAIVEFVDIAGLVAGALNLIGSWYGGAIHVPSNLDRALSGGPGLLRPAESPRGGLALERGGGSGRSRGSPGSR